MSDGETKKLSRPYWSLEAIAGFREMGVTEMGVAKGVSTSASKELRPASPTAVKQALAVLGMHRSGASALAHALSHCGFALPQDLAPARPDNPRGFFEPSGVVRLNGEILSALHGAWDRPEPLFYSGASPEPALLGGFEEKARKALRQSFTGHRRILLKDPRMCLLLPIWRQALEAEGFAPAFVHIYRHPLEVAQSLYARNALSLRRGLQLWQFHVSEVLGLEGAGARVLHVDYNELLSAPRQTLARVLEYFGGAGAAVAEEAVQAICGEDRHHEAPPGALGSDTLIPRLVRATWRVLTDSTITGPPRLRTIASLQSRVKEATNFLAMLDTETPLPPNNSAATAARPLLLHYHLFKNAGTSIDEILKLNFGARWTEAEFRMPAKKLSNVDDVETFLNERPNLAAFSSHTALLPPPKLKGREVVPFLFIRHPIDRLMSAYAFERKQIADTHGARLAKSNDFRGYLRAMLDDPHNRQARNFQTSRLAFNEAPEAGTEFERALRALSSLFFVGLVEEFEKSLKALEAALQSAFPAFKSVIVHKNKTQDAPEPLKVKLSKIKAEIGEILYEELCSANEYDTKIFEHVRLKYEAN